MFHLAEYLLLSLLDAKDTQAWFSLDRKCFLLISMFIQDKEVHCSTLGWFPALWCLKLTRDLQKYQKTIIETKRYGGLQLCVFSGLSAL